MSKLVRVLLVEDSEDDELLLLRELRRGSFEVTHVRVETAEDMQAALARQEWDIVISDHAMPHFDSVGALKVLQESGLDLPFIIVSGTIGEDIAVAAMKAGAHDYIIKGKLARLLPAVERELREAQVRREHRWAEEARRAAEEKYRTIFENAVDGIFQTTPDGRYLTANPALARMLGYASPQELMASVSDIQHQFYVEPQRRAEFICLMEEQGSVVGFESPVYRKDGSVIWISENARAVRDANGTLLYYEGTTEDISVRKQAEKALRESEERYRLLFDQMLDGFALHEILCNDTGKPVDYRFLEINPAFEKLTGLRAENLIGETVLQVLPNTESYWIERYGQVALSGQPVHFESYSRELGKHFEVAAFSPRPGQFATVFMDITERKRAEEQVRRNAARAEALARTAARLNAQLNLEAVLNAVCEETTQALNAPAASVLLYDARGDALYQAATLGLPPEYRRDHKPNPRAQYDEITRRTGPFVFIPDVQADPSLPNADLYRRYDIRTLLGATMSREGQLVGVLGLYSFHEVRTFPDDELALLQGLADQAAQAIANARLFEQEQSRREELGTLYDLSRELAEAYDFDAILDLITRHAVATVRVTFARLMLWEGDQFVVRAAYPRRVLGCDLEVGRREPITALPFSQRALTQNDPIVLHCDSPEIGDVERAALFLGITQTLCLVPLRVSDTSTGQALGLLMSGETRAEEREPFTADKVRLARSIGDQAATALHRATLRAQTEQQLQRLTALRAIDSAITGSTDLNLTLKVVLQEVISQLRVDAATVLLLNPHTQILEYAAGRGFHTKEIEKSRLRLGEGYAGKAALEHETVIVHGLQEDIQWFVRASLLADEGFVCYFGVPLISKGQVRGVLEVFTRSHQERDREWLDFLGTLAGQAAIAIDNASLLGSLQRSNAELVMAYDATIEGWSRALDLRDRETEGHTQRVTELTVSLARAMGTSEAELVHARRGALLHDMGKMGIPDHVLLKPDKLTDEEWEIMRQHPTYAFEMLSPIAYLRPALDIPYGHHEKWDGSGYPRRLKGESIPLPARIFAVVDVYDALTSDRPYRPAWSKARALQHIGQETGKHFDPRVVEVFLEVMRET